MPHVILCGAQGLFQVQCSGVAPGNAQIEPRASTFKAWALTLWVHSLGQAIKLLSPESRGKLSISWHSAAQRARLSLSLWNLIVTDFCRLSEISRGKCHFLTDKRGLTKADYLWCVFSGKQMGLAYVAEMPCLCSWGNGRGDMSLGVIWFSKKTRQKHGTHYFGGTSLESI